MKTFKIFGLLLLATVSVGHAQDINQAKKAIDAEKYEEAKTILKSILQAKPSNGMASFLLGNVYLNQSVKDSAAISFGKGLVQEDVRLRDGSNLRLTIARYYTPTGRCIQKPYNKNYEEYYEDQIERYENGELYKIDSTLLVDSLKFKTPKGKIVAEPISWEDFNENWSHIKKAEPPTSGSLALELRARKNMDYAEELALRKEFWYSGNHSETGRLLMSKNPH